MADVKTVWYHQNGTDLKWHVEIGSAAQLRLAADASYVLLESLDEPESSPISPDVLPALSSPVHSEDLSSEPKIKSPPVVVVIKKK